MTILMQQKTATFFRNKTAYKYYIQIGTQQKKNRIKFTERVNKSVYLHRRI